MGKAIVINADFSANSFDHVTFDVIHATSITVTPSTLALNAIGATSQLSYTVLPADAQDTVQFISSNADVATVTSDGLVTVTGCGSCTITATAGNVSGTCAVTVVIPMTTGYVRAVCGYANAANASNTLTNVEVYSTNKLYHTGCCAIYNHDETMQDLPIPYTWVNTSTSPYTYQSMEYIQQNNPWSQLPGWIVPIKLPHNCTKIRFKQLSADYGIYPLFFKYNVGARDFEGLNPSRLESPKLQDYPFVYETETVVPVPAGFDSFAATWQHKGGIESGAFASMSASDLAQFTVEFLNDDTPYRRTLTGNPLSIDVAASSVERLQVDFLPVQAGSGTPSPSNVRTISGWSAVAVSIGSLNYTTGQLSETVYGGTVDLVSGTMTITHKLVTFDGSSDESWNLENSQTAGANFYIQISDADYEDGVGGSQMCNMAVTRKAGGWVAGSFFISSGKNLNLAIGDLISISTVSAFKTWLSTHNVQLYYKLATPQTVSLTAQTVTANLGANTVSSDAGVITIRYWAH